MNRADFPNTPAEMDAFLGFESERIADGALTPGRNKVVWKPSATIKIVYEEHPYDAVRLPTIAARTGIWIRQRGYTCVTCRAIRSRIGKGAEDV